MRTSILATAAAILAAPVFVVTPVAHADCLPPFVDGCQTIPGIPKPAPAAPAAPAVPPTAPGALTPNMRTMLNDLGNPTPPAAPAPAPAAPPLHIEQGPGAPPLLEQVDPRMYQSLQGMFPAPGAPDAPAPAPKSPAPKPKGPKDCPNCTPLQQGELGLIHDTPGILENGGAFTPDAPPQPWTPPEVVPGVQDPVPAARVPAPIPEAPAPDPAMVGEPPDTGYIQYGPAPVGVAPQDAPPPPEPVYVPPPAPDYGTILPAF
jgi:hypothetical protein